MNKITKSYIKLFSKSLLETFGTIIFIGFFILICLPLLSFPLQITSFSQNIKNKTNTWNYWTSIYNMSADNVDFEKNTSSRLSITLLNKVSDYFVNEKSDDRTYTLSNDKNETNNITFFKQYNKLPKLSKDFKDLLNLEKTSILNNVIDPAEKEKLNNQNNEIKNIFKHHLFFYATKNYFQYNENNLKNVNVLEIFKILFPNSYKKQIDKKTKTPEQIDNFKKSLIFNIKIFDDTNSNWKEWTNKMINEYAGDFWSMLIDDIFHQLGLQSTKNISVPALNTGKDIINFIGIMETKEQEQNNLDNLVITKGDYPSAKENDGYIQAVANDRFLNYHNYKLGQKVVLDLPNYQKLKIQFTGVGYKYDRLSPQSWVLDSNYNGSNHANIFVYENTINKFISEDQRVENESLDFYIKDNKNEKLGFLKSNINSKNENLFAANTTKVVLFANDYAFEQLNMAKIMTIMYSAFGLSIMTLAFAFIIYVQKKELSSVRKQMGVFKSIGYSKWALSVPSTIKIGMVMYVGIVFGYLISIPMQIRTYHEQYDKMVLFEIHPVFYSPWFMAILLIALPIFFIALGYLIIIKYLSERPLSLLSDIGDSSINDKPLWWKILLVIQPYIFIFIFINRFIYRLLEKTRLGFKFKLQSAFVFKSKGKFIIVVGLYAFAALSLLMEIKLVYATQTLSFQNFSNLNKSADHWDELSNTQYTLNYDAKKDKDASKSKFSYNKNEKYNLKYINLNGKNNAYLLKNENKFKSQFDYDFYYHFNYLCDALNESYNDAEYTAKTFKVDVDYVKAWYIICAFFEVEINPEDAAKKIPRSNKAEWIQHYKKEIESTDKINDAKIDLNEFVINQKKFPTKNTLMFMNNTINEQKIKAFKANDLLPPFKELVRILKDHNFNPRPLQNRTLKKINDKDNFNWDDLPQINLRNSVFINEVLPVLAFQKKDNDTLCALNGIIFDGKQETLFQKYSLQFNELGSVDPNIVMTQTRNNDFGNIANSYSFSSQNKKQLKKLLTLDSEHNVVKNPDNSVNGIISVRLSKWYGAKIGDTVNTYIKSVKPIKIHVVGIQESSTYEDSIIVDSDQFSATYADDDTQKHYFITNDKKIKLENIYAWNHIISNKKQFFGKIDSSLNADHVKVAQENLCISSKYIPESDKDKISQNAWFFEFAVGWENDSYKHITLNNFITLKGQDGSKTIDVQYSYYLEKLAISFRIQSVIYIMIFNTIILILLLAILFMVLVKFIIFDSKNIIILLRSLGYRDSEINLIILGKYLTSTFIAFIVMCFVNYLIWNWIESLIWTFTKSVFHTPTVWWAGYFVFLLLEFIVLLCWIVSGKYIKKLPLSRL